MLFSPIKGFEGIYEISDCGIIRSKRRKVMKVAPDRYGYYNLGLWDGSAQRTYTIHRLVALTFIPNPENKPHVNHKNGIKTDNRVENLEWCTVKENIHHAHKMGFYENARIDKGRIIIDTQTGVYYDSIKELAALLGYARKTVSEWLQGKYGNKDKRYQYAPNL